MKVVKADLQNTYIHLSGCLALIVAVGSVYALGLRPAFVGKELAENAQVESKQLLELEPILRKQYKDLATDIAALRLQAEANRNTSKRGGTAVSENQPILNVVSELLLDRELTLQNFRESLNGLDKSTRVELQVEGSYIQLTRFLRDLEDFDQPTTVVMLQLTSMNDQGTRCSAKLNVNFALPTAARRSVNDRLAIGK